MAWLPDHIWLAQKKGKGKVKGKGRRSGWLPDHIWLAQKKGKGKGKGKGGKGKRGGFRCKDKVENRLWIGGLPEIEDREKRREASEKLKELLAKKVGECKMA